MSISPPVGHGPLRLVDQNAGHVPQPVGMCFRSSTTSESPYAALLEMRTESRPRSLGERTREVEARMMKDDPETDYPTV
jgi:hypothetical protein